MKNNKPKDKKWESYLNSISELDSILEKITRDYCRVNCVNEEGIGCCGIYSMYAKGVTDNDFLYQQSIEAKNNGWDEKISENNVNACYYFLKDKGCSLRIYKPPVCIGHLCKFIEIKLIDIFDYDDNVKSFIETMQDISDYHSRKLNDDTVLDITKDIKKACMNAKKMIEQYETKSDISLSERLINNDCMRIAVKKDLKD